MNILPLVASAFAVLGASLAGSWLAARELSRRGVVDVPNARSSHRIPVPRGGAVAFVFVALIGWAALTLTGQAEISTALLVAAVAVATISFADDVRGVAWPARLAVQAGAIALGLLSLPGERPLLFDWLPLPVDRAITGLMWLWFVNLFNFMDGIDGIASVEALVVTLGIVLLAVVAGETGWPVAPALILAAAVAGFLPFNLPPARMFMGDVGSATLGFLIGWLLIRVAAEGALATALLLALYFIADATITLVRRAVRRESLHRAHRLHAYQRAVDGGRSHGFVSTAVGALGLSLVALGGLALSRPMLAFGLGLAVTLAFMFWLGSPPPPRQGD